MKKTLLALFFVLSSIGVSAQITQKQADDQIYQLDLNYNFVEEVQLNIPEEGLIPIENSITFINVKNGDAYFCIYRVQWRDLILVKLFQKPYSKNNYSLENWTIDNCFRDVLDPNVSVFQFTDNS